MITANDAHFQKSGVHRLEKRTWPTRYVVCNTNIGWNECHDCGREHRIWMTDDALWRQLPRKHRKKRLCVACFRRLHGRR